MCAEAANFSAYPLCVAAGWLRLNPWMSMLIIGAGKFARYLVIAWFAV